MNIMIATNKVTKCLDSRAIDKRIHQFTLKFRSKLLRLVLFLMVCFVRVRVTFELGALGSYVSSLISRFNSPKDNI